MKHRTPHYPAEPAAADRPVIWTVSVSRLSRLLHDITPEFDTRARIENIHLGFEDAVTTLRGRLRHEHCDVLIAAGSNGAYLKNRLELPVVLVRGEGVHVWDDKGRRYTDLLGGNSVDQEVRRHGGEVATDRQRSTAHHQSLEDVVRRREPV